MLLVADPTTCIFIHFITILITVVEDCFDNLNPGDYRFLTIKNPVNLEFTGFLRRAIDGARTRGLDLGKVARYQLRHYRIYMKSLARQQ